MGKEIRGVFRLGMALLALTNMSATAVSVPDWLRLAASQPAKSYPPDTKAEVLLDDQEITVTGAGEYQSHYRRVVRILRPEGRKEGELGLHFVGKEKAISLHAWTIDKSGREYELKDKDFEERGVYGDYELYTDLRFRSAKAPAAEPGSVVGVEYEVQRHLWLNEILWLFQEEIPVRQARFTAQFPTGWEFKTSWFSAPTIEPAQTGENRWQWTVHDLAGIDDEPMMPPHLALSGRMELAYFGPGVATGRAASWQELGQWYGVLTAGRRRATPEISQKVRELTAEKSDFDAKSRALASFLQADVRYVAVEVGIGGFQPHPAGEVFRARYGDCKDKATLLSSMLQEAGIRSDYVVIHTQRGIVNPSIPSTLFNHVILAIALPAGVDGSGYHSVITARTGQRYLIFDPTDEYTPFGELRADLQSSYALLVTDSGGELIHTPLLAPDTNTLTRSGHFTLTPEGDLEGEVIEDRSGDHASRERARLAHGTQQQRNQQLERFLNSSLKGFTLQSADIRQFDQVQKDLVLDYRFQAPQYAQIRGSLMLVRPRVLGEKSFEVATHKPRQYPIELESASQQTDTYEIEIPSGYAVDDLPEPVKVDMGFASYQSRIEVRGSKLRYWREYIVRDLSIGPDHLSDLRNLEGMIGADEEAAVVLKRAQ